jgi:hypothetical protein
MIFLDKNIKLFFLKKHNAVLTFIVAILGIMQSCKVKYGTDPVIFILNGNIKSSSTNQPIDRIEVTDGHMLRFSDSTGNYTFGFENYEDEKAFLISYKDKESIQNGSFKDKDTVISFDDASRNSNGEYTKTIDVHLDPK